jgi:cell division protein FtsB
VAAPDKTVNDALKNWAQAMRKQEAELKAVIEKLQAERDRYAPFYRTWEEVMASCKNWAEIYARMKAMEKENEELKAENQRLQALIPPASP